ncbi:DnaD domain protein [Desulfosporosinus hippei]|uniref:DnaD domain protein n=1 Tax=Desulfosporosinus hippei TaxID=569859 RepID=UPI0015A485DD|nr:DnaD domain protein [Desulfosporosinus hippei]
MKHLSAALDANVKNMNYLRAVLTDWRKNGILTLAHIEAREIERKSQKDHKRKNKDPGDKPPEPPKPGKYENCYL